MSGKRNHLAGTERPEGAITNSQLDKQNDLHLPLNYERSNTSPSSPLGSSLFFSIPLYSALFIFCLAYSCESQFDGSPESLSSMNLNPVEPNSNLNFCPILLFVCFFRILCIICRWMQLLVDERSTH